VYSLKTLILQTTIIIRSASLSFTCSVAFRLNNFVVGLTNDDPATTPPVFMSSYTVCAQYDGLVAAGATVTVTCAPSAETFRYVIVQGSITEAICLLEVEVYGRSKCNQLEYTIMPLSLFFYLLFIKTQKWNYGSLWHIKLMF